MCGIAGAVWTANSSGISQGTLETMTDALAHRGPDDRGFHRKEDHWGGVGLGHRRLSIIGLDSGHQPLCNEDERVWISFNGEIYNYVELRQELQASGHRFRTETDTEVIVHLFEEEGIGCLQKLRGMFAFALWDERDKTLWLARDRMGQKPLVYRHDGEQLIFASELKALLRVPNAPHTVSLAAINAYLTYQYVPHPQSILEGYAKLPPAHWAKFRDGALTIERYWSPFESAHDMERLSRISSDAPSPQPSPERGEGLIKETLKESVRLRMRSDVPIGAFLSGGLDSTIISGLMQSLAEQPIHTFSIGFDDPAFDEREYARLAAEHLGTIHHEHVVTPDPLQITREVAEFYDEPFADSSAIPTMYVSRVAREFAKVILTGDAGDELFAGYDRYRAVALAARFDRLPSFVRNGIAKTALAVLPKSVRPKSKLRRLRRFLSELPLDPRQRYFNWISIFSEEAREQLFAGEVRQRFSLEASREFLRDAYFQSHNITEATTFADMQTYLPCDILTKVDIASMSCGLECRSPFLDHHVLEAAVRTPFTEKYRDGIGKRILREEFRSFLPPRISRRSKMGFGVPLARWFREELREFAREVLLDERAARRGLFRRERVEEMFRGHLSAEADFASQLWALLMLELWYRRYVDGAGI